MCGIRVVKLSRSGCKRQRRCSCGGSFFPTRPFSVWMWIRPVSVTPRSDEFIGEQKDPVFLKQFIKQTGGEFDIIIDDGEHTSHSTMRSFVSLFPVTSDPGIYLI